MANPKVMLVGYGNMGKFHARVLDKLGMLAAIVEPFEKNREIAAQSYDVPTFATIEGLKDEMDAAVIAVPTSLHLQVLEKLIRKKPEIKFMLLEKPLGATLEEGLHAKELVETNGITAIVGHVEVYNPVISKFIEIIKSGKYGNVRSFIINRKGSVSADRLKSLSGVLEDIGVHDFDIVSRFISGDVQLYCTGLMRSGSLNNVIVSLYSEKQQYHGTINLSREFAGKERKIVVECDDATISIDLIAQTITITGLKAAYGEYGSIAIPHGAGSSIKVYGEPLQEEHLNLKKVILGQAEPIVSVNDGITALKLVHSCKASLEKKLPVPISI